MKIIKDYIEVLFLQVPVTAETLKVKEDLLNTAEDHFEGLIAEGVSEKEAIGIVISEFGSIDDILMELELDKVQLDAEEPIEQAAGFLSLDEVTEHWSELRSHITSMGIGLSIIVFGFACLPFLEYGYGGILTTVTLLFIFFLWGTGFLIFAIHLLDYRKQIRQLKDYSISEEVFTFTELQMERYRKSYHVGLTLGFLAFLFSLPILFILSSWFISTLGIFFFFLLFGAGSFLICYVSLIQNGFKRIINMYTKKEKRRRRMIKKGPVTFNEDLFWVSVVIIYFAFSFMFSAWLYSWLIFLVGFVVSELIKSKHSRQQAMENEMF